MSPAPPPQPAPCHHASDRWPKAHPPPQPPRCGQHAPSRRRPSLATCCRSPFAAPPRAPRVSPRRSPRLDRGPFEPVAKISLLAASSLSLRLDCNQFCLFCRCPFRYIPRAPQPVPSTIYYHSKRQLRTCIAAVVKLGRARGPVVESAGAKLHAETPDRPGAQTPHIPTMRLFVCSQTNATNGTPGDSG